MKIKLVIILAITALALAQCQREPYREGGRLYAAHCANCHGENGQGLGELIPPIAGSDYLKQQRAQLACLLVNGMKDSMQVNGKWYSGQPMPENKSLSPVHVTNILNFINNSWGNAHGEFSLEEVQVSLKGCDN